MPFLFLILLGSLCLFSCRTPPVSAPVDPAQETKQPDAPPPILPREDPGAQLTRVTQRGQLQELPSQSVEASARLKDEGHTYLSIARAGLFEGLEPVRIIVETEGYALATWTPDRVLIRFARPQPSTTFRMIAYMRTGEGSAFALQEIHVAFQDDEVQDPSLSADFRAALAGFFDGYGKLGGWSRHPFFDFAAARFSTAAGSSQTELRMPDASLMRVRRPQVAERDLMTNRGHIIRPRPLARRDVGVNTLAPIAFEANPYQEWLDAHEGPGPQLEDMASMVPDDVIYAYFGDLRSFLSLGSKIDEWIIPVLQLLELSGMVHQIVDRYEEELILERSQIAETMGHHAVESMAVLVDDPFLIDGSEVAIVMKVKNRALLMRAVQAFEDAAQQRRGDLRADHTTIAGRRVQRLQTPDGRLRQHRVEVDGYLIVSNGASLLEKVLQTKAKTLPSLAQSSGYRWMRTHQPFDAQDEAGFLYIPDEFVARAQSAPTRIQQLRRAHARADLRTVSYLALLYGWLNASPLPDLAALRQDGLLAAEELKHADGSSITLDPLKGVFSTWGRPDVMTPLSSLPAVAKVTADERRAWDEYREDPDIWLHLFAGAAAVFSWKDEESLAVEWLFSRPTIEDFGEFDRLVGRTYIKGYQPDDGLRMVAALGPSPLRTLVEEVVSIYTGFDAHWLGTWASVDVHERWSAWDFALARTGILHEGSVDTLSFPGTVTIELADDVGFRRSASRIEEVASVLLGEATDDEPYGEILVRKVGPLCWAVFDGHLVLAMDRGALELQIEAIRNEKIPSEASEDDGEQFAFDLQLSEKSILLRTALAVIEVGMRQLVYASNLSFEILDQGRGQTVDNTNLIEEARRWLGAIPRHPQGGGFSRRDGVVEHSLYGSIFAPHILDIPVEDARSTKALLALRNINVAMRFDDDGPDTVLRVKMGWSYRSSAAAPETQ